MTESAYQPAQSAPLPAISLLDVERYEDGSYESLDYDEYESQCALREGENARYLDEFHDDLVAAGLKDKTVSKHIDNVYFYLNTYLTRTAPLDMRAGCYKAADYLGDFFIRKCMWSTPASIRSNAASFKKFYKSMLQRGYILQDDYDTLRFAIKEGLDYWCDLCAEYNTPGSSNPFSPFADDPFEAPGVALGGDAAGAMLRDVVGSIMAEMHAAGLSDAEIVDAMEGVSSGIEERIALYEADDETVLAALAATGLPADRKELEQIVRTQDSSAHAVDALCKAHRVDLGEDEYGMAEWVVAILHDRWIEG